MGRLLLVAALAGGGCAPPRGPSPPGRAHSWRMIEVATPGGKQLVLEAYDAGPPEIEIRFVGEAPGVGEPVEAEIRLPGSGGVHTLELFPTRPQVRILGPQVIQVRGEGPIRVRFTSDAAGKGGIGVFVRE